MSNLLRRVVVGVGVAVAAVAAMSSPSIIVGEPATELLVYSSLPSRGEARGVLNASHFHPEVIRIAAQDRVLLAAVTYPVRADSAPTVVVAAAGEQLTPWVRAVADQLTAEGFIAVVPDAPASDSGAIEAAAQQLARHPAADGRTATVTLASDLRIDSDNGAARFALSEDAWASAVNFLHSVTGNERDNVVRFSHAAHDTGPTHDAGNAGHATAAVRALAGQPTRTGAGGPAGGGRPVGYPFGKVDDLPAGLFTAKTTVLRSPIEAEWVDIPTPGVYNGRMHTRISYPAGTGPAGIVVVMQHGPGMDEWMQAVGDQLSRQGFIALVPDLHTGMGPNGGNYDSFAGPADVFEALTKLNPEMSLAAYQAVREYGLKLPRANGKSASLGFCMGGGNSWALAMNVADLDAAVVYYGTPRGDEADYARINAPVIAFYGEDDARVTAGLEAQAAMMNTLGKAFESHAYPHATHGFLEFQDLGGNAEATLDSWTRTIAFLKEHIGG